MIRLAGGKQLLVFGGMLYFLLLGFGFQPLLGPWLPFRRLGDIVTADDSPSGRPTASCVWRHPILSAAGLRLSASPLSLAPVSKARGLSLILIFEPT